MLYNISTFTSGLVDRMDKVAVFVSLICLFIIVELYASKLSPICSSYRIKYACACPQLRGAPVYVSHGTYRVDPCSFKGVSLRSRLDGFILESLQCLSILVIVI